MTQFEVQLNSPVSSPSPSPPELPSQLKRKRPAAKTETTKKQKPEANFLCIEEGINDPYVCHPESPASPQLPAHLSAPSPLISPSQQQIESSTQTSLPALLNLTNTSSDSETVRSMQLQAIRTGQTSHPTTENRYLACYNPKTTESCTCTVYSKFATTHTTFSATTTYTRFAKHTNHSTPAHYKYQLFTATAYMYLTSSRTSTSTQHTVTNASFLSYIRKRFKHSSVQHDLSRHVSNKPAQTHISRTLQRRQSAGVLFILWWR